MKIPHSHEPSPFSPSVSLPFELLCSLLPLLISLALSIVLLGSSSSNDKLYEEMAMGCGKKPPMYLQSRIHDDGGGGNGLEAGLVL